MKLIHKYIDKDSGGRITVMPDDPDDMWHAYNLIGEGDSIRASTFRKIQIESATGSVGSNKVRTTLTVQVESIDFDSQSNMLRVKGRNIEENQYVKMGAYHTLDLEPNRKFTLSKQNWDSIALERIEMACDPGQNVDLAAVVMQEGLAYVCLITTSMTLMRAKIDTSIPRKRKGQCAQRDKALHKFYENIVQAILRHINFDVVKCVILASPGFVKDQFYEFMFQEAVKLDQKVLTDNKGKFLLAHSSSGFKHSLKEVLADAAVLNKLADTRAAGEVKMLDAFFQMLQVEAAKAFYGLKHVEKAAESQAIEHLLISDTLFRSSDFQARKRYVALVDSVREAGGEVKIFSSLHVSGQQLDKITGIAAILRFPMPELEDDDDSSSGDEELPNNN